MRNSVYVTTAGGQLGPIHVDGDVALVAVDYTLLPPARDTTLADVARESGVVDGLPADLIAEAVGDLGIVYPGQPPQLSAGPDRSWAYVTFVDQTFASDGHTSADATVVYLDWSLWLADGPANAPKDWAAWQADMVGNADSLGPDGRAALLADAAHYAEQMGAAAVAEALRALRPPA